MTPLVRMGLEYRSRWDHIAAPKTGHRASDYTLLDRSHPQAASLPSVAVRGEDYLSIAENDPGNGVRTYLCSYHIVYTLCRSISFPNQPELRISVEPVLSEPRRRQHWFAKTERRRVVAFSRASETSWRRSSRLDMRPALRAAGCPTQPAIRLAANHSFVERRAMVYQVWP